MQDHEGAVGYLQCPLTIIPRQPEAGLALVAPSEGDSCPAVAGAGCPAGELVLRRLGSAPAAAAAASRAKPEPRKGVWGCSSCLELLPGG